MSAAVQVLVDGGGDDTESAESARTTAARAVAATAAEPRPVDVLDGADGPRHDPYGLARRLPAVDADAVVLVAPRRRGPRRLAPGPVVDGRPVALVQADGPDDLARTLLAPDPHAPWVVAAMAKNVFLEPTEHWAATLRAGGHDVVDLRADRARRDDLVAGLRAGPRVVLYAGHGRPRGWAGYQALRFHHLASDRGAHRDPVTDVAAVIGDAAPVRAAGLVIAFACDTLGRAHNQWPFGVRLVESGMVRAYLGPASAVLTADARALADVVVDILAHDHPRTVTDLVVAVDRVVAGRGHAAARRAWQTFRLVGAPDTCIT
ncbi:MAG TPA: hypothetical protein VJ978_06045 [Nitriliruptoraceae bacterium]|nr:hypothetical protein [Nitriliruptoraceae bacterium]